MKAKNVRNIEKSFITVLKDAPGFKEDKIKYFLKRGIRVTKINYERMWNSLVRKLGRVEAANVVFDYLLYSASSRLNEVLDNSLKHMPIKIRNSDPKLIVHLFHSNGNPKRIGEYFIEYKQNADIVLKNNSPLETVKKDTLRESGHIKYDVALSFAGEERKYVHGVATSLKKKGIEPYFDEFERIKIWGKDLAIHFDDIFRNRARYCVIFSSVSYAKKAWPRHELRSALARAIKEKKEYILPVKIDNTDIPRIPPTVGYLKADEYLPEQLADIIIQKLQLDETVKGIQLDDLGTEDEILEMKIPITPDRGLRKFNLEKARTKIELLRDSEIKGQTRLDIWDEFRHLFPALTRKELSNQERRYVREVISLIQRDLDDEDFWERGLDILGMISSVQNKSVINKIKKMSGDFEKIYDELPTTKQGKGEVLKIYRNIARNKDKFCRALIDQSINDWTDEEFNNLRSFIDFDDLKNKESEYKRLYKLRSELEEWNDIDKVERVKKIIEDLNRYRYV